MKLTARRQEASSKYDHLRCVRSDGSVCEVGLPRQGILPHDLIHLWVESRLGFSDGFIGLVAKGADMELAGKELHRHVDPACQAQAAQAESVVEALQSQLWSGVFDAALFRYGVDQACAMRGVASPDFADIDVATDLFDQVLQLGRAWSLLPAMSEWDLEFPWRPGRGGDH
jgi:hypothetical protein